MVSEGVFFKLQGLENATAQLRALPDKLRKRVILNALRAGGRVFRDEARRLTPVLQVPVRRKGGGVIRKPGTVQKAINVRTSKLARRGGDVGVFVNVRPAKGANKGAKSPNDPFYWRFINFGTKFITGRRFFEGAANKSAQALNVILGKLGPAVQKIVDRQAAE